MASKKEDDPKLEQKQIAEIEQLAGIAYSEIECIYHSGADVYDPNDKSLDMVIYDLKHGGYTAIPF